MPKCRTIDNVIAQTRVMFFQTGRVSRDSDCERALQAFNISMTTRMEREIVEALRDMWLLNISQPTSGYNWWHWWKCVFESETVRGGGYKLVEREFWARRIEHEPPCITEDSCRSDICSNNHVSEEQPSVHKRFAPASWCSPHDIVIGRIKRQCRCRKTVYYQLTARRKESHTSHKINPQQLNRN